MALKLRSCANTSAINLCLSDMAVLSFQGIGKDSPLLCNAVIVLQNCYLCPWTFCYLSYWAIQSSTSRQNIPIFACFKANPNASLVVADALGGPLWNLPPHANRRRRGGACPSRAEPSASNRKKKANSQDFNLCGFAFFIIHPASPLTSARNRSISFRFLRYILSHALPEPKKAGTCRSPN